VTKKKVYEPGDREDEAVARLLDGVQLEDPPHDLKENVLRAIEARPEPAREGWLESLRAGLRRSLSMPMAPLAAGAAVAVIALALLSGRLGTRGIDTGSMEGVMAPLLSKQVEATDDQRFELNGANVRLQVARSRGQVFASVSTRTSGPVAITLQFDPSWLHVERLEPPAPRKGGGTPDGIDHGTNWVRIRQSGDGRARVVFRESGAGDAPIQVGIASGTTWIQGTLHTRPVEP
jgi:hypothetical protein